MMLGHLVLRSKITCKSAQRVASTMVAKRSLFSHAVSPSTKDWFGLSFVISSQVCDAMMILRTMRK